MRSPGPTRTPRPRQDGIALFVVLVTVLMTSLLVLGASHIALVNEIATGIDSDRQRTLEAAEAMVRDAERDIQGAGPDGSPCAGSTCRGGGLLEAAEVRVSYPTSVRELLDLQAVLGALSPSCAAGICVPDSVKAQFWTDRTALAEMKQVAAGYGDYTVAASAGSSHPLLASGEAQRAWYWVELLPYNIAAANNGDLAETLAPDRETPFIYRITAVAQGLHAATQAVVQTTLVWKKRRS